MNQRVRLHDSDVLKNGNAFFGVFSRTDDDIIKTIHVHLDLWKRLKRCIIYARPIVADATL